MKTSKSWVAAAVLLFVNHIASAAAFTTGPVSSFRAATARKEVPIYYHYHRTTTFGKRKISNAILKVKSDDDNDDNVDLKELRRIVAENDAEWYREFVVNILGEEYEIPNATTNKQQIDDDETEKASSKETTENLDKVEKKKTTTTPEAISLSKEQTNAIPTSQNATRTSESSDTHSKEPKRSSKEQANLVESNRAKQIGLADDDASQAQNNKAPGKEEQPIILPTTKATAKSQAAANKEQNVKAANASSPKGKQQTHTGTLANNGSESARDDVIQNDDALVVSPKDDTVEDSSTALEIEINGNLSVQNDSVVVEELSSDTDDTYKNQPQAPTVDHGSQKEIDPVEVNDEKAAVQAADFDNDTSFNCESENKLKEEEQQQQGATLGDDQSNRNSVDKEEKKLVNAKDDSNNRIGRVVSNTPENESDGVLPTTRKDAVATNAAAAATGIQSKKFEVTAPANVESANDDDLDETSSSSSDTTTIPKVNGDGDVILLKAVTEAATTETNSENDATAAAVTQNDEIESLDESSSSRDHPEQFEVHYRDLYDRKLVKVVSLTTLTDLGYRVSEIPYLQTDALDLIVQESIKKPVGGLPTHWMISRNQYKVISDDVRIVPKEQKEQEEADDAETQLNDAKKLERNSGQARSEAPRGPPAQRGQTSTNKRQAEPAASRRPPMDKEGPRRQNRTVPKEVELREGPRRRRRPTREQTMEEGDTRRPADTNKRIYTGRERIRRKRKPQRNTHNDDPPSPNWFWMDMDTFRNLLAAESEIRLRILGKGWAPTVRKEAKWREETYSNWLRLFDKGVGEDLFESRREREKRTRQRQSRGPPVDDRRRPVEREQEDMPWRPDDNNGREGDRLRTRRQSREPPADRRRPVEREEEDWPRRPDDKNGREADRLERQRDNVNGYSREYMRPEYNGRRPGTGTARAPPDQEWRQRRPDSGRPPPRMERNPVSRRRPQERNR